MSCLTNKVDPDEMPNFVASHQGLHCMLRYINKQPPGQNTMLFVNSILSPLQHNYDRPSYYLEDSIIVKKSCDSTVKNVKKGHSKIDNNKDLNDKR